MVFSAQAIFCWAGVRCGAGAGCWAGVGSVPCVARPRAASDTQARTAMEQIILIRVSWPSSPLGHALQGRRRNRLPFTPVPSPRARRERKLDEAALPSPLAGEGPGGEGTRGGTRVSGGAEASLPPKGKRDADLALMRRLD